MLKNRLFIFFSALLISITMIVTAAFVLYHFLERSHNQSQLAQDGVTGVRTKPVNATETKENTVLMPDITTNLTGYDTYIRVSFAFELENKKTKDEFEKLDFKVRDLINRTLADMKAEEVQGSQGQDSLTSTLINKINSSILTQGKLKHIYITEWVLN